MYFQRKSTFLSYRWWPLPILHLLLEMLLILCAFLNEKKTSKIYINGYLYRKLTFRSILVLMASHVRVKKNAFFVISALCTVHWFHSKMFFINFGWHGKIFTWVVIVRLVIVIVVTSSGLLPHVKIVDVVATPQIIITCNSLLGVATWNCCNKKE